MKAQDVKVGMKIEGIGYVHEVHVFMGYEAVKGKTPHVGARVNKSLWASVAEETCYKRVPEKVEIKGSGDKIFRFAPDDHLHEAKHIKSAA